MEWGLPKLTHRFTTSASKGWGVVFHMQGGLVSKRLRGSCVGSGMNTGLRAGTPGFFPVPVLPLEPNLWVSRQTPAPSDISFCICAISGVRKGTLTSVVEWGRGALVARARPKQLHAVPLLQPAVSGCFV